VGDTVREAVRETQSEPSPRSWPTRHHLVLERVEQPRHSGRHRGRHSERGGEGDTERAFSSLLAHPPPPGTWPAPLREWSSLGVVGTGLLRDVSTLCAVVPPPGLHGVVRTASSPLLAQKPTGRCGGRRELAKSVALELFFPPLTAPRGGCR
jgi:hypothetical protein